MTNSKKSVRPTRQLRPRFARLRDYSVKTLLRATNYAVRAMAVEFPRNLSVKLGLIDLGLGM